MNKFERQLITGTLQAFGPDFVGRTATFEASGRAPGTTYTGTILAFVPKGKMNWQAVEQLEAQTGQPFNCHSVSKNVYSTDRYLILVDDGKPRLYAPNVLKVKVLP
jgi:hypothetical protein